MSASPLEDRWTQYWAKGDEYQQLDYTLASRKVADANPRQKPLITRDGLPKEPPGIGVKGLRR